MNMMFSFALFSTLLTLSLVSSAVVIEKDETIMPQLRKRPTLSEYNAIREKFVDQEQGRGLGAKIVLTPKEERVNKILMGAKLKELADGFKAPFQFTQARHLFEVLGKINNSEVFKIIEKMPKGAILHAHDTAICSTAYVVSITYRENLWQCRDLDQKPQFIFARNQPAPVDGVQWKLVADIRKAMGNEQYDTEVRKLFTLFTVDPTNTYKDINTVWSTFMDLFIRFTPIITYEPVWKDYYYQALKECQEDNVQYLEFRGTLPDVYNLDGRIYSPVEIVQMYVDVLAQFKKENPEFSGSKFIYAPIRIANDETFDRYLSTMKELHNKFPNFVVGFDLVGQEDMGRPLTDYIKKLLTLPEDIQFFFHAGETNWNGISSDENLIDAVLLGTRRIGHGFAVVKHPKVMEAVKDKDICIEVNPISNQVLKLVDDYRNHPASIYFSDDYPVVISSDDPSFWEAKPLSHDFYQAFLGIASAHQDIRVLRQLALNSLKYSVLTDKERNDALNRYDAKWSQFINEILVQYANDSSTISQNAV